MTSISISLQNNLCQAKLIEIDYSISINFACIHNVMMWCKHVPIGTIGT